MKSLCIASAFALGSTLALAQTTQAPTTSQQRAATPSAANSQVGGHASDYWTKSSKGGYMTRDQAMGYTMPDGKPYSKDGKPMEFGQVDSDGDGRISQKEWGMYHGMNESGGSRSGATGATSGGTSGSSSNSGATGGQSTGSGATGSGTTAPADGARSGSTPRSN